MDNCWSSCMWNRGGNTSNLALSQLELMNSGGTWPTAHIVLGAWPRPWLHGLLFVIINEKSSPFYCLHGMIEYYGIVCFPYNLLLDTAHVSSSSSGESVRYSTMPMRSTRWYSSMFCWQIFSSTSFNKWSICCLRSLIPTPGVARTSNRVGMPCSPGYPEFWLAIYCNNWIGSPCAVEKIAVPLWLAGWEMSAGLPWLGHPRPTIHLLWPTYLELGPLWDTPWRHWLFGFGASKFAHLAPAQTPIPTLVQQLQEPASPVPPCCMQQENAPRVPIKLVRVLYIMGIQCTHHFHLYMAIPIDLLPQGVIPLLLQSMHNLSESNACVLQCCRKCPCEKGGGIHDCGMSNNVLYL